MKKNSLLLASMLATSSVAVAAPSDFDGFKVSLFGDWSFLTVTEKGGVARQDLVNSRAPVAGIAPIAPTNDDMVFEPAQAAQDGEYPIDAIAGHTSFSTADRKLESNGLGKVALNLGYTKVMLNNVLVGASIFGGWDFSKISGAKDVRPVLINPVAGADADALAANKAENSKLITAERSKSTGHLAESEALAGSYGLGANLTLGYVLAPKVAVRALGEISCFQKKLTSVTDPARDFVPGRAVVPAISNLAGNPGQNLPAVEFVDAPSFGAIPTLGDAGAPDMAAVAAKTTDTTAWNLGLAAGAAVDVAVSDRIILTLGAKCNLPTTLEFKKANNKDQVADVRKFDVSSSWNIFAEVAYRVTQD